VSLARSILHQGQKKSEDRLRKSSLRPDERLGETSDCPRLRARQAFAESFSMNTISNIARAPTSKAAPMRPVSLGRPRWTNLTLAASLIVFWAGVILKILG
jgi:hypothetical protein